MTARLTSQQLLLRGILEKDWQATVEQIARAAGWRYYHPADNVPRKTKSGKVYVQNVRAGFPDLTLVRGVRVAFAELKTETGSVADDQAQWLTDLARNPLVEVYVWRPRDLDEITRLLALRTRPPLGSTWRTPWANRDTGDPS